MASGGGDRRVWSASTIGSVGADAVLAALTYVPATQMLNEVQDQVEPGGVYVVKSPYADYGTPKALTAITHNTTTVTITVTSHGLDTGDMILLITDDAWTCRTPADASDLGGPITGRMYTVTKIDADILVLNGIPGAAVLGTSWQSGNAFGSIMQVTLHTAHDPDTDITDIETSLTTATSAVTGLDGTGATGDVHDAVALAITEANLAISDSYIESMVDTYEVEVDRKYAERTRKYCAGMVDVGAANSTAYMMGTAYLEQERRREIRDFRAKMYMDVTHQRTSLIESIMTKALNFELAKVEMLRATAHSTLETMRIKTQILNDETNINQALFNKHSMFELDRLTYVHQAIAGFIGAPASSPSNETAQTSDVGRTVSYAAAGATVGAAISGPAAPVGAAIGAGVGAFAGILESIFD